MTHVALEDEFNLRVLKIAGSRPGDFASARSRIERDLRNQKAVLLGARRRIWTWVILDLLAISLLTALATRFFPGADFSGWLDRIVALQTYPTLAASLSLAALCTVIAFAVLGWLTTTEHD